MTKEELSKIPFKLVSHMNGDTMVSHYKAETDKFDLRMIDSCRRTKKGEYVDSEREVQLNGKTYYTIEGLLDAINELEKSMIWM